MKTLNSWELDVNIARENEKLIKQMYVAFIEHNKTLPSVEEMVGLVKLYNCDVISKELGDCDIQQVLEEYDKLEDNSMFVMMGDYIRTIIVKNGGSISEDSASNLVENGIIKSVDRVPDTVIYGDRQHLIFPQFCKNGVYSQGPVLNVSRDGVQYLQLGSGE